MQRKLKQLLKYALTGLLLAHTLVSPACTIFMANDGTHTWVGNNEDERQNLKYRIWYYPATKNNYGYAIWTELFSAGLLNGLAYLNPQGGLNEYGLFMDFTAIAEQAPVTDPAKKNRKKQVVTDLLKKCKTVDEALAFLEKYNLIGIKSAQLFIGDAGGNYATVHGGYIVRKTSRHFALTNYCIKNGHREACYRREAATQYLLPEKTFELNDITTILEKTAQKLPNNTITNYSMAVNLKTGTLFLYRKGDFSTVSVISLSQELKKGKHHKNLDRYFPKSIVPIIEKENKQHGINAAVDRYRALRKNASGEYNFTGNEALNLAISWIEKGQLIPAISLLECLREFSPGNMDIFSWLGVAHRKNNNIPESDKNFAFVLKQNPDDYLATLYGKQEDQKITFKLAGFEGAEQVSVVGDFTGWTKNPVKMKKENGIWYCQVLLPKGDVIYKFLVNNEYLADSKNYLHIGRGPDVYSKL